jgi:hypothetical protein
MRNSNQENSAVSEETVYKVGHASIFRSNFEHFSHQEGGGGREGCTLWSTLTLQKCLLFNIRDKVIRATKGITNARTISGTISKVTIITM